MKNIQKIKKAMKQRRKIRVRKRISGNREKPRLSVYRSLKHIYVQLVDDQKGRTLLSASDLDLKPKKGTKEKVQRKIQLSHEVGKLVAEKALKKKIMKVVFDRGSYKYHGRIKAVAEGARDGGLKF